MCFPPTCLIRSCARLASNTEKARSGMIFPAKWEGAIRCEAMATPASIWDWARCGRCPTKSPTTWISAGRCSTSSTSTASTWPRLRTESIRAKHSATTAGCSRARAKCSFLCATSSKGQAGVREELSAGDTDKLTFSSCTSGLAIVGTWAKTKLPTEQRAERSVDRNHSGMPNENVHGLEVGTMQFEQSHTRQAAQRAGDQSRGGGIDRESTAKHQPAQ